MKEKEKYSKVEIGEKSDILLDEIKLWLRKNGLNLPKKVILSKIVELYEKKKKIEDFK